MSKQFQISVDDRLRQIISTSLQDRVRYIELEARTQISADIWKNFWFKRRKADAKMLESLAREWPQFAFWLATGATDVQNGHVCPSSVACLEWKTDTLQTAPEVLRKSVEATVIVETLYGEFPEEADQIASTLNNFLKGGSVHKMPPKSYLFIDKTFKTVKALNLAVQLRDAERKLVN